MARRQKETTAGNSAMERRMGTCGVVLPIVQQPTVERPVMLGVSMSTIFDPAQLSRRMARRKVKENGNVVHRRVGYFDEKNKPIVKFFLPDGIGNAGAYLPDDSDVTLFSPDRPCDVYIKLVLEELRPGIQQSNQWGSSKQSDITQDIQKYLTLGQDPSLLFVRWSGISETPEMQAALVDAFQEYYWDPKFQEAVDKTTQEFIEGASPSLGRASDDRATELSRRHLIIEYAMTKYLLGNSSTLCYQAPISALPEYAIVSQAKKMGRVDFKLADYWCSPRRLITDDELSFLKAGVSSGGSGDAIYQKDYKWIEKLRQSMRKEREKIFGNTADRHLSDLSDDDLSCLLQTQEQIRKRIEENVESKKKYDELVEQNRSVVEQNRSVVEQNRKLAVIAQWALAVVKQSSSEGQIPEEVKQMLSSVYTIFSPVSPSSPVQSRKGGEVTASYDGNSSLLFLPASELSDQSTVDLDSPLGAGREESIIPDLTSLRPSTPFNLK